MTWNVNWGGPRADLAVAAIAGAQPDIVCLQETTPAWEGYLRQTLSDRYRFMVFKHPERWAAGGFAFLSKYPGADPAVIPSATGWFGAWAMSFDTPAGIVRVINTHLMPAVNDEGRFSIGAYLQVDSHHLRELELFGKEIESPGPILIAGDLNESDDDDTADWLAERGFSNSLPEFDSSSQTWSYQTSLFTIRKRLDHILYRELHCCSAEVLEAGGSDHYPVIGVFTKPQDARKE